MKPVFMAPAVLALSHGVAAAQTAAANPAANPAVTSPGSLLQVLFGLVVVLALMAAAAWAMKRMGVSGTGQSNVAKVVGGVNVGTRERVLVVEVADQWIVVGVAAGRVSALSTMPRQELPVSMPAPTADMPNFAGWLKQTMDRRNASRS